MRERSEWTGEIVKQLHINGITQAELAVEMGVTHNWVSMVLNGDKTADGYEQRMMDAISAIKRERAGDTP